MVHIQAAVPPAPLPENENIDVEAIGRAFRDGEIDMVVVLGPTASGKTRYAVELARKLAPAEIISADSRQVYRGMTIGTGKDLGEYGDVPYHLIDIVDAGEKYTLYEYQRDFEKVYADIRGRGVLPILCGGTGLYIDAVVRAYNLPAVPPDPELRARLEEEDIEDLREAYAERTNPDPEVMVSKRRLVRALEVLLQEDVEKTAYAPKRAYFIGTLVSREERNARIDKRLDERLDEGLVEEVRGLLESGLSFDDLMYYGLEYRFVAQYLMGVLDYESMRSQLATAIHQFAKRQMTYFRGMESHGTVIHWTRVS